MFRGLLDADGRSSNGCELRADPGAVYVTPEENGGSPPGIVVQLQTLFFN